MTKISKWLSDVEKDITPIVIMNGDFNLPFIGDWSEERISELLEQCSIRDNMGRNISPIKPKLK